MKFTALFLAVFLFAYSARAVLDCDVAYECNEIDAIELVHCSHESCNQQACCYHLFGCNDLTRENIDHLKNCITNDDTYTGTGA
mmetsp:Transcript_16728/g.14629  ORF Transcript_16728/g.14629 Transcript_16728/m.14629 type:complete len:84 (-) Transcript_16728:130-381(-)